MAPTVRIPTVLRPATGGAASVQSEGATVGEVIAALVAAHPGVREQVLGEDGGLHKFLNVYVNDDDIRYTGGLETPVAASDEVTLLPAVAGGAS